MSQLLEIKILSRDCVPRCIISHVATAFPPHCLVCTLRAMCNQLWLPNQLLVRAKFIFLVCSSLYVFLCGSCAGERTNAERGLLAGRVRVHRTCAGCSRHFPRSEQRRRPLGAVLCNYSAGAPATENSRISNSFPRNDKVCDCGLRFLRVSLTPARGATRQPARSWSVS